ncbi:MAG: hypothetical protein KJN67_04485 [Pontiella sp.]|nr:hypothetical protein [Pontiella sp.]
MWVRFREAVLVDDEHGRPVFEAAEGETIELPDESGDRWIRRGKAVKVAYPKADPEIYDDPPTPAEALGSSRPTPKKKAPAKKASTKKATRKKATK